MITAGDVRSAAQLLTETLGPAAERDWSCRAGPLEWSVSQVISHVTDACGWYAANLAIRSRASVNVDVLPHPGTSNEEQLDVVAAVAGVLADVIHRADSEARGWHSFGMADPEGFAGMACDELLVHGHDMASGLDLAFDPDPELCARLLVRMFPWAPSSTEPWPTLLWANGRLELAGFSAVEPNWAFHCAPLDEWDGRPLTYPRST